MYYNIFIIKNKQKHKGENTMTYQSKKDPEVTAAFDFEDPKYKTTRLIYLTGPKKGQSIAVSNSTLKRWWKKLDGKNEPEVEEEVIDNPLNLDFEQVNQPYKPNVTPHFIPKPQSVIEYEEQKHSRNNSELPSFEELCDMFGPVLKKINEKSVYMIFKDKTALHRKAQYIKLYTVENIWTQLAEKGLESKPNNDKDRPFAFTIKTKDDFDIIAEVLIQTLTTKN